LKNQEWYILAFLTAFPPRSHINEQYVCFCSSARPLHVSGTRAL
jgi:hypothetical protein